MATQTLGFQCTSLEDGAGASKEPEDEKKRDKVVLRDESEFQKVAIEVEMDRTVWKEAEILRLSILLNSTLKDTLQLIHEAFVANQTQNNQSQKPVVTISDDRDEDDRIEDDRDEDDHKYDEEKLMPSALPIFKHDSMALRDLKEQKTQIEKQKKALRAISADAWQNWALYIVPPSDFKNGIVRIPPRLFDDSIDYEGLLKLETRIQQKKLSDISIKLEKGLYLGDLVKTNDLITEPKRSLCEGLCNRKSAAVSAKSDDEEKPHPLVLADLLRVTWQDSTAETTWQDIKEEIDYDGIIEEKVAEERLRKLKRLTKLGQKVVHYVRIVESARAQTSKKDPRNMTVEDVAKWLERWTAEQSVSLSSDIISLFRDIDGRALVEITKEKLLNLEVPEDDCVAILREIEVLRVKALPSIGSFIAHTEKLWKLKFGASVAFKCIPRGKMKINVRRVSAKGGLTEFYQLVDIERTASGESIGQRVAKAIEALGRGDKSSDSEYARGEKSSIDTIKEFMTPRGMRRQSVANGKQIHHPTLFYQKEPKVFILQRDEYLWEYEQRLQHSQRPLDFSMQNALNYVAEISQDSWLNARRCSQCFNDWNALIIMETISSVPDNSKSIKEHYIDPEAAQTTLSKMDDDTLLCRECRLFGKLNISRNRSFSDMRNQHFLLLTGIFTSPAFWVMIPNFFDLQLLMNISKMCILVSTVGGFFLIFIGFFQSRHKDPYNLVPAGYHCFFFVAMFVMNVINVSAIRNMIDFDGDDNVESKGARECVQLDLDDDINEECLIYIELISASFVILIATLFINCATIRVPPDTTREDISPDLKKLWTQASKCTKNGIMHYFQYAIDMIEETRVSEVPGFPLGTMQRFRRVHVGQCLQSVWRTISGKKWKCVLAAFLLLIALGATFIGAVFLPILAIPVCCILVFCLQWREQNEGACCGSCCGTADDAVAARAGFPLETKDPSENHSDVEEQGAFRPCSPTPAMLVCLIPVMIFISLILGLSTITHPRQYLDLLQNQPGYSIPFGIAYFIVTITLFFFITSMWRVTQLFNKALALMRIPSRALEIISREKATREVDDDEKEPLDPLAKIVDPKFVKAWWALREHIQKKELAFFFRLTNPLISLEIVFVLGTMLSSFVMVLRDDFGGDIFTFLFDFVIESNLILLIALMCVAILVTLLVHLGWLLFPYREQNQHLRFIDRITLILRFEAADATDMDKNKHRRTMELLQDLREQMVRVKVSPKLLGVFAMNENVIKSIIGAVTVPLTAMALSFVQDSFSEIAESSGFGDGTTAPTVEPTFFPTSL